MSGSTTRTTVRHDETIYTMSLHYGPDEKLPSELPIAPVRPGFVRVSGRYDFDYDGRTIKGEFVDRLIPVPKAA